MGMVVRTNTMAMNANRQLGINNTSVGKSLEKLSSGFRINRAADDASGLAISEKMKAQIKGLETASANSQDGISLIQTAEGGAQEIHDMLNRMTELATKSANGTIQNDVDREAIQREVDDLNAEISRIASSTNFNGIDLLNGNLSSGSTSVTGGSVPFKLTDAQYAGTVTNQATASSSKVTLAAAGSAVVAGDKISIELVYQDAAGKAQTKTVEFTATSATSIVGASGTAHNITSAGATAADLSKALAAELTADPAMAGQFTATQANATDAFITMGSTEKGAAAPKVLGVSMKVKGAAVAGASAVVTAGTDKSYGIKYDQGGGGANMVDSWDGTGSSADHVFQVGGKKFAFVDSNAAGEKLDKDVNYVVVAGAGVVTDGGATADAEKMAALISQKTGISGITVDTASHQINFAPNTSLAGGGLTLQVGDTNDSFNKVTVSVDDLSAAGIGTNGLDVSSQTAAGDSIKTIKTAINKVSTNRANLGSLQNRLEHTINNLDTTAENMTAANSRIRDTDMAKEMMNYTKNNILTQAAQAMLAQANQQPQAILQLLQ